MLTDLQYLCKSTLPSKFATKLSLKIPPQQKRVTTLPCQIQM